MIANSTFLEIRITNLNFFLSVTKEISSLITVCESEVGTAELANPSKHAADSRVSTSILPSNCFSHEIFTA